MILRRLATSIRKQDWFTVLIETMVVVFGVFIGLQVNNWNEARVERAREAAILNDLLADVRIDRAEYAGGIAFAERRISAANHILGQAGFSPVMEVRLERFETFALSRAGVLSAPNSQPVPQDDLPYLWSQSILAYHPTPSTAAYDALVGAGDLNIIRDNDLVRDIQLYRNLVTRVRETQATTFNPLRNASMEASRTHGLSVMSPIEPAELYEAVSENKVLAATARLQAEFALLHVNLLSSADESAASLEARLIELGANK